MITMGSLFSGIGSAELAGERVGITTLWASEIDPQAASVHARHFPRTYQLGDIRHVGKHNAAPVDIVVGGSPCQDLSIAGNRAGLAGARSGLFHEYIRVIRECRPSFAIWENVPGALSANRGRDFASVLSAFQECGAVDIAYRILDAQYFGVAQRRRRVFVVVDFRSDRAGTILFEPEGTTGHRTSGGKAGADIAYPLTTRNQRNDASSNETFIGVTAFDARNGGTNPRTAGTIQARAARGSLNATPLIAGTIRSNGSGLQYASTNIPGDYIVPVERKPIPVHYTQDYNQDRVYSVDGISPALTSQGYSQAHRILDAYPIQGAQHGATDKTNAGEILRILRDKAGTEAFCEWGIAIAVELRQAEILQSGMHGKSIRRKASKGKSRMDDGALSRSEDSASRFMSALWSDESHRRASQGWGLDEQQYRQLGAYLSQLSQPGASRSQGLLDLWEASQGIGVLREALSEIQEVRQSVAGQNQSEHNATYRVRRLMPIEAERLMGFPDRWTQWDANNREMADTPRYRMLGNSMAVPVMEWILRRMAEVLS